MKLLNFGMSRRLFLVIFVVALGCAAPGAHVAEKERDENTVRVLFIGNSHTYTHDVPQMVKRLNDAQPGSPAMTYRSVAEPAFTLQDHLRKGKAQRAIQTSHWHFVVIQPASMEPFHDPKRQVEDFRVLADSTTLDEIPILFGIWHREPGHEFYGWKGMPNEPALAEEMIRRTNLSTIEGTRAHLAATGDAWSRVMQDYPDLKLYSDGNHTTVAGAYLAACVVLRSILRVPLSKEKIWLPDGLSTSDAGRLIDTANAVKMTH